MDPSRRRFLNGLGTLSLARTPIAAALAAAGCKRPDLPEGMVETKFDRDVCSRCSMVISDRRFAAQVKGGPKRRNFKFDDIGCVAFWLRDQGWGADPDVRIWVADSAGTGWLDARKAYYVGGRTSPMGYNFAAVGTPLPGALDFNTAREHILAKGK